MRTAHTKLAPCTSYGPKKSAAPVDCIFAVFHSHLMKVIKIKTLLNQSVRWPNSYCYSRPYTICRWIFIAYYILYMVHSIVAIPVHSQNFTGFRENIRNFFCCGSGIVIKCWATMERVLYNFLIHKSCIHFRNII